MKELLEEVLNRVPKPVALMCIGIALAYFLITYTYVYSAPGDVIRNKSFQSIAIILLATTIGFYVWPDNRRIALVFIIACGAITWVQYLLKEPQSVNSRHQVVVAQCLNDKNDNVLDKFVTMLEVELDKEFGAGSVQKLSDMIDNEDDARRKMETWKASSIIYDVKAIETTGAQEVSFRVLTKNGGPVPRLRPILVSNLSQEVEPLIACLLRAVRETRSNEEKDKSTVGSADILPRLTSIDHALTAIDERVTSIEKLISPKGGLSVPKPLPSFSKRRALIVAAFGVSNMPSNPGIQIDGAMALTVFRQLYGFETISLEGPMVSRDSILQSIKEIAADSRDDQAFVFYYSGNVGQSVSLTTDRDRLEAVLVTNSQSDKWLRISELLSAIRSIKSRNSVVLIDGCHATSGVKPVQDAENAPLSQGIEYFGACRANQTALDDGRGGLFSQALFNVLRDSAVKTNGIWMEDVVTQVQAMVERSSNRVQSPEMIRIMGNSSMAWMPVSQNPNGGEGSTQSRLVPR